MVGVAPGADTERFAAQGDHTTRFSFRVDMAPWLSEWYAQWKPAFPEGWSVHWVWINRKYELQDHLVQCFDDAVDWPDYIWSIASLRARRERLRRKALERPVPRRRFPAQVVHAYEALGCPVGVDIRTVNKVYREASHQHHPDKGGSVATMSRINRAVRVLRDYLQRGD